MKSQAARVLTQGEEGGVSLAAFDCANVGAVQTGVVGEPVLRLAAGLSQSSQSVTQLLKERGVVVVALHV